METIIAIDVDDTVANLMGIVPRLYNAVTGENISRESFHYEVWDHSKVVKYPDILFKMFAPWVYDFVNPIPGALYSINAIKRAKRQYKIAYCTASISGDAKIEWLKRWNFIDSPSEVIITMDKSLIKADILIDDYVGNLIGFKGEKWAYPQPWNKNFTQRGDWDRIVKWLV